MSQQEHFEIVYRRARHAASTLKLKANDTELRRLVQLSITKGESPDEEAAINRHVARIVVHLAKGAGIKIKEEALKEAVREASRAAQGETTTRLPDATRKLPSSPDEEALAKFISYTGGGTQQMTDDQHREVSELMAQMQIGMASQEIERQELQRQWEQYQRKFRHAQRRGCLGRLLAVPGCLGIALLYLLLSSGLLGVLLLGLLAFFLSRGGDFSTFIQQIQQTITQILTGQSQNAGGAIPLPPQQAGSISSILSVAIPGGLTILAIMVAVTAVMRRTVRSVIGTVMLAIFVIGVGAAAFYVAQNGAVAQFIARLTTSP